MLHIVTSQVRLFGEISVNFRISFIETPALRKLDTKTTMSCNEYYEMHYVIRAYHCYTW